VVGSWREHQRPGGVFAAFAALQALHEMLFLLRHAPQVPGLATESAGLLDQLDAAARSVAASSSADVSPAQRWEPIGSMRSRVGALLSAISAVVRGSSGAEMSYQDLAGADLRTRRLASASLRGAVLIGADLSGVYLARCDLLGADLRDSDIRGAQLEASLFLTQPQANAAIGDASTTLPESLSRPAHWTAD